MRQALFILGGVILAIGILALVLGALWLSQPSLAAVTSLADPSDFKTFVTARETQPQTLDPHAAVNVASLEVTEQVYETLLAYPSKSADTVLPHLAMGWEISSNGTVYTFTIRPDLFFHAGGRLQPHDVAYSFWRVMLQEQGASWLFSDVILNVGSVDELPGDDTTKCQAIQDAVTFDDREGQVAFHLPRSFGPFLYLLAEPYSVIVDQEWVTKNGGWGGSCSDWRDYHQRAVETSPLYDRMNGTGPFRFRYWISGEVGLTRNDGYWHDKGPAALEEILFRYVPEWNTRYNMLTTGAADWADVPRENYAELEPLLWSVSRGSDVENPALLNPTGTLRLFRDLPDMTMNLILFSYDISTATNPYIGSGTWDGNGIPPDFFSDIHVRQAFNYAMDWDTVIATAYSGEGLHSRGPIPRGVLGYRDSQPADVYSPTLSRQAFQQAWGGQLWTQGFSLTLAYNEQNSARQQMAQILKENVEAISQAFHIEVISLPWSTLIDEAGAGRLPLFPLGWRADYNHPHNWVDPFLHSDSFLGSAQRFPPAMAGLFDAKVDQCVGLTDSAAAATCYAELQSMAHFSATAMYGVQSVRRHYERTEVRGYVFNPALLAPDYYALSKSAPPSMETVDETVSRTLVFTPTAGTLTSLQVPSGAVTTTTTIVYTPQDPQAVPVPTTALGPGGPAFDLDVYRDGQLVSDLRFQNAVSLTIKYSERDVANVDEETLGLYRWTEGGWQEIGVRPGERYVLDMDNNLLAARLSSFSRFGQFARVVHRIFLPLGVKKVAER